MKRFLLFFLDIFSLFTALILTLLIRHGDWFGPQFRIHLAPFSIIFIVWLVTFYILNLYEPRLLRNTIHFYSALFEAIGVAALISVAFFYLIPYFLIAPKTNLALFIVLFSALVVGLRSLYNRTFEKKFKKPTLIVGINPQALELAKFIKDNPQFGYELRYAVDLNPKTFEKIENDFEKFGIIQGLQNLEHTIINERINTIIISPEAYQTPDLINIFYRSIGHKISFFNLSSFYERLTGKVPLGAINQIWFLENFSESRKTGYEIIKRSFDIVLAIVIGLLSLLIYPFVILAIAMDSPGPIFYRQKRVGQAGKVFEMIKFRTMAKDAEKATGPVWASDNDPRTTRTGRFMRKTRIDELPQVWNILQGEMSFVGPRAERPEFHETLQKNVPFYEERYLIKPGLTGWAQINFRYGSSVADAAEKLQYDLYYIKNRSPILDFGIILKTVRIALQQAGK